MSWFQLDPESVLRRAKASRCPPEIPCLGTSVGRGILGFTFLSIAGFAPWALAGRFFHRHVGEAGLYSVCAVVFIALSGPLLHRLIVGPGSLSRFYKLFSVAFVAYSALWIAGWMTLRGHAGSLVGLLAGTAAMGWIFARAFEAQDKVLVIIAALFVLNSAGYFVGGWVETAVANLQQLHIVARTRTTIAMLLWGVCYGVGLGAALGSAFHICQVRTRAALKLSESARASG